MSDQIYALAAGPTSLFVRATSIALHAGGAPLWESAAPIEIEHFNGAERQETAVAYQQLEQTGDVITATAVVPVGGAEVMVEDRWFAARGLLQLERTCTVRGEGTGGFLTRLRLHNRQPERGSTRVFVPGMIYGGPDHLTRSAIGGADTWDPARAFTVLIREDRMPAPLVTSYVPGGSHLLLFDAAPTGDIPLEDSHDTEGKTLLVDGMRLNSLGFTGAGEEFAALFCAPANEGEVTYSGVTYPGGQMRTWRRRYQTLGDGARLSFVAGLTLRNEESFAACATAAWRLVFDHYQPQPTVHDLDQVADSLVRRMTAQVGDVAGRGRGLPNFLELNRIPPLHANHFNAILGFTGKNLEAANVMLRWTDDHPGAEGDLVRREAEAIIATIIGLKVDPPEGEGYVMATGEPTLAIPRAGCIFLRSFGDDVKVLARAYLREAAAGRNHPDWRAWIVRFGDWLLTQQRPDGSFPRTWEPGSGRVLDPSPFSTYNAIPLLAHLTEIAGDARYLNAAIAAGDFCWQAGHADFVFVGGTIDNPDIIDKEAGTLSLDAYLALHAATHEPRWIERAQYAADFAETWVYIWNVPIPPDEDDARLHWKKGLPTVSIQIIASGHSLTDMYMAFDADEYAKLHVLTGDAHYLDVARLLLHATKTMVSLPGRLFDLGEEGWQQEHWTLAPPRGFGLHRGWLPWVATSHLAGMYDLKDFDPALYARLAGGG